MSTLKLKYLRMEMTTNKSPFGVEECEDPLVYEKYADMLQDRVIIKVDALNSLKVMLDKGMFIDRDSLYCLVSGSVESNMDYSLLLESYYKKFVAFANYIDASIMFEDSERNLLQNIMIPIRNTIESYKVDMKSIISEAGGKLVLDTHDYLYFAFKADEYTPIDGVEIVGEYGCIKQAY